MMYYLIQRQSGGCDYTIECGTQVTKLKAKSMNEAKEEANDEIGTSWRGRDEIAIESAEILEVSESVDLSEYLDQKKAERVERKRAAAETRQRKKDEEKFAQLQRKLGK